MPLLDDLKKLIKVIEKSLPELKGWQYTIDSANYQTHNRDELEKTKNELETKGLKLDLVISHGGRKIYVFEIPENLKTEFQNLNFIELSEPKPSSNLEKSEWEYVSLVIADYDNFVETLSKEGKLEKVRQIGEDKFSYLVDVGQKLQFRNRSVGKSHNEFVCTQSELELENERNSKLQLMADFDNYRKRCEERMIQLTQMANIDLVKDLLEIVDDMERLLKEDSHDGIKSIYDKFLNILAQKGFERIVVNPKDRFDMNIMEAVTTIPTPDNAQDNVVHEVLLSGYKKDDRIVRHAKVVVSKFGGSRKTEKGKRMTEGEK